MFKLTAFFSLHNKSYPELLEWAETASPSAPLLLTDYTGAYSGVASLAQEIYYLSHSADLW